MHRIPGLFALLAAVVFVAAGLGDVPSQASAQSLEWEDCGGEFECTTLTVPLDYDDPGGLATELALVRRPANDDDDRIGSLLVNPGGPGASGIEFVRAWAGILDDRILDRFDIVGWDPRGIGASSPLECHDTLQQYIAADPSPDNQEEFDALAEVSKTFADDCARAAGPAIDHYGTKNVARDLDQIRGAVGDEKLTYLGYSYGTVIGQVYAQLFPGNIRAMVLDGAVDLSLPTDDLAITQAEGFERALQNFLDDCRSRDDCRIAEDGDPADAINELLARVEVAPIPAPQADRPAGPGETLLGVLTPLYNQAAWRLLEVNVERALDGNGSGLVQTADAYLDRRGGEYSNSTEMNLAVNCIDNKPSELPVEYDEYVEVREEIAKVAPHFGPALATGFYCEYWAAEPDPLEPPTDVTGIPQLMVISTTGDPATPYEWGLAVHGQLRDSVLITYRGEGHTVYGGQDECVDDAVNDYLVDLVVPAEGLDCGDGPPPPGSASPTPSTPNTPAPPADPGNGSANGGSGDETGEPVNGWVIFGTGVIVMFGLAAAGTIWMSRRR